MADPHTVLSNKTAPQPAFPGGKDGNLTPSRPVPYTEDGCGPEAAGPTSTGVRERRKHDSLGNAKPMMCTHTDPKGFGLSAEAEAARVEVRTSYRLGRRVSAPITPEREAFT